MADYIPSSDDDLDLYATNFLNWLNFNFALVGLTGADLAPLQAENTAWLVDFPAFKNLRTQFKAATQTKDGRRKNMVAAIRVLAQRIQTYPGTTDAIRTILGLTIPGSGAPPPPPGSIPRPLPTVKSTNKLEQVVRWKNEATGRTPNPPGFYGVQVFLKIGDPPTGIDDMELAGVDSANPYTRDFDAADAGKTAHWVLRYTQNSEGSGAFGPQSEVESATILG